MKSVTCRTILYLCTSTKEAIALLWIQKCAIDAVRMQAMEFSECTVKAIAMSTEYPETTPKHTDAKVQRQTCLAGILRTRAKGSCITPINLKHAKK